jgi:hypothetical protein
VYGIDTSAKPNLISDVAVTSIDVPDTGSPRGDVRGFLGNAYTALCHPLVSAIIPDLLAEANRRGELAADADAELCLDVLTGPLYWRLAVIRSPRTIWTGSPTRWSRPAEPDRRPDAVAGQVVPVRWCRGIP